MTQISTEGLAYIASAVCGRNVKVVFTDRRGILGEANNSEIRLSRRMFTDNTGDACDVFLHELGHALLHGPLDPDEQCENEANAFAEAARSKLYSLWFYRCLRGELLRYEYEKVIGRLKDVASEFRSSQIPVRNNRATTQRQLSVEIENETALYNRIQGKLTKEAREIMQRSIRGKQAILTGEKFNPVMERMSFSAAVRVTGTHGNGAN